LSKRHHPALPEAHQRPNVHFDLSPQALGRWNPQLAADGDKANNVINILDQIGVDWWTGEGTTAKRISAALRAIGEDQDVIVNLNSPGGDYFEGQAIYTLLSLHPGRVTVRVLGLAASAASVVAMAGDEIQIARAGWLMVHNAWIGVYGNRNDLRETADWLEPFDRAAADLYAERTGLDKDDILAMLDRETWIGGADAVDQGWADSLIAPEKIKEADEGAAQAAIRKADVLLAKAGMPRSERRRLFQEIKTSTPTAAGAGAPKAAGTGTPTAAPTVATGQAAALSASLPGLFKTR